MEEADPLSTGDSPGDIVSLIQQASLCQTLSLTLFHSFPALPVPARWPTGVHSVLNGLLPNRAA